MGRELTASGDVPDALIIQRSLTDPDAFAVIFDRHFDTIHGYLARRIGGSQADDLASSTFTVAFERRHRFRAEATTARPWLFGIATNLLRSHRRAEKRAFEAWGSVNDSSPGEFTELTDLAHLASLLARLNSGQRDVLLLHAWEDLSYEEIAQSLGISIGTVRSRLARARSRLRVALSADQTVATQAPEVSS